MQTGILTLFLSLWTFLALGGEIPNSKQSLQGCFDSLTQSQEAEDGLGDRKWGHFWISGRVAKGIQKDYFIPLTELERALQWVREGGTSVHRSLPQASHFAVIEIPDRGKFRLHFRSLGPEQGSRILGLTSLLDLESRWTGPWQTPPEMAQALSRGVFGWSHQSLEAQAKWFGADLNLEPPENGIVIHFNSAFGSYERDLQIAFGHDGNGYTVRAFDFAPLFYLAPNVRDKLASKHKIGARSLIEIFSRWDKKAAREKRANHQERENLPRYWMIGQTESGRLVKVVFAWDTEKQLPIIISTFDANLQWMIKYNQEARRLK